jgi:hypothetical protein
MKGLFQGLLEGPEIVGSELLHPFTCQLVNVFRYQYKVLRTAPTLVAVFAASQPSNPTSVLSGREYFESVMD